MYNDIIKKLTLANLTLHLYTCKKLLLFRECSQLIDDKTLDLLYKQFLKDDMSFFSGKYQPFLNILIISWAAFM